MKSLFLLLFFIAVSSAQNCLSSADRLINKRCFTFVNQQLSYQDARDWCHFRNPVTFSYLATVPDANTANFLASIAHTLFNNNGGYFWIGLSRYNNKFQWDDGTPVSWTNFQLQNSQNYVAESITNAKWTTYPNDNKYNFICSYDPNGSQTGRPTYPPDSTTAPWVTTAETDTPPGPTPTADSCTRRTNTTILLAYSADSLQSDVDYARRAIIGNVRSFYPYQKFANIRFDVKQEENIQYHSDLGSFNASVIAHPADSTIGYGDKNTGSDVFNVIEKFLNNDQATICGSIIYVLVKRYPNGNDVADLIIRLRANNVFVYFIVHNVKSGGSDTKSLFDMSSETNGFCIFMDTTNYWAVVNSGLAVLYRPYQFIAQNYVVYGEGRIEIPNFRIPCTTFYCQQTMSVITIQDHKLDTNYISLNYTISTLDGTHVFTGPDNGSGWPRFGSGIIAHPKLNGTVDYKLTIDYKFRTSQSQFIEVRMYSSSYHDFVPFNQQEEKCTRRTNSTVLFAYSTESAEFDFVVAFNSFLSFAKPPQFHGYTTYANVRFDTKQEEDIQYHSDINSFNASVSDHWVNSSIGYGDTTTGSDVFRVIQKFLNNNQATVCGSLVYVLVKRYPNEVDVTDLITRLRENHVFVYFIVHDSPSGGTETQSLFDMSSKTNGFCVFVDSDDYYWQSMDGIVVLDLPYQFIAQNYIVSGSGEIEIPAFKTPDASSIEIFIVITVQDHKPDNNFVSLNYTVSTMDNNPIISHPNYQDPQFGTGLLAYKVLNGTVDYYKMKIDYIFKTTEPQVIELRMYSNFYQEFLPFASN